DRPAGALESRGVRGREPEQHEGRDDRRENGRLEDERGHLDGEPRVGRAGCRRRREDRDEPEDDGKNHIDYTGSGHRGLPSPPSFSSGYKRPNPAFSPAIVSGSLGSVNERTKACSVARRDGIYSRI